MLDKEQLTNFASHIDEFCVACESRKSIPCQEKRCLLCGVSELPTRVKNSPDILDKFFDVHGRARTATTKLKTFPILWR